MERFNQLRENLEFLGLGKEDVVGDTGIEPVASSV